MSMSEDELTDTMHKVAQDFTGNRRYLLVLFSENRNDAGVVDGLMGTLWTSYEPGAEPTALAVALSAIAQRVSGVSRVVRDETVKP